MSRRPNILVLMTDQHAADALGAYGNAVVHTPHLDSLAARSICFQHAYCSTPMCVASRASFMTGLFAHHHRCYDNGSSLSSEIPTFAHALTLEGYETTLCARMHFNGRDQYHGFEKRLASEINEPVDYPPFMMGMHRVREPRWGGVQDDPVGEYTASSSPVLQYDDYIADQATAYLCGQSWGRRPFLLVASFYCPHGLTRHREEYRQSYRRYLRMDLGAREIGEEAFYALPMHVRRLIAGGGEIAAPISKSQHHHRLAEYYSRVTYVDMLIGRILDALRRQGLEENTIILYVSDHGDDMGFHGYDLGKMCFYESVVRVPLLISGLDRRRGVVHENVSLVDFFPTLCELAGSGPLPYAVDGRTLMPLMQGDVAAWRNRAVFASFFDRYTYDACYMVKKGHWKYNVFLGEQPDLHDLMRDPHENVNLAGKSAYADKLREMHHALLQFCDPVSTRDEVYRNQLMRQFVADSHQASVIIRKRIHGRIQEYRARHKEPWYDASAGRRWLGHLQ